VVVQAGLCALRVAAREPCGRKEGSLFCVFTARLKPCPDTFMVDGCGGGGTGVWNLNDWIGFDAPELIADKKESPCEGSGIFLCLF
jgi:hypothetical protein